MNDEADAPAALEPARRIVIVDSDHRVRASITGLLELTDGIAIVGTAGTADEALAVAGRTDPDAILLDPRLPETEAGLALIDRLRESAPRSRILVMFWEPAIAEAALGAGADGVVDKCADPAPFAEAVLAAVSSSPDALTAADVRPTAAAGPAGSDVDVGRAAAVRPPRGVATRPAHP
ncbi:MAG: response regulator transcription factor [Candidatus Limnocylindrales bacterium]